MKSMRPKSDADHFPPPRSVGRAVIIALSFPGILIWHLAKYCNSQEGRLAKVGMIETVSPFLRQFAPAELAFRLPDTILAANVDRVKRSHGPFRLTTAAGKRRSVTAFCHIDMPTHMLGAWRGQKEAAWRVEFEARNGQCA
jgi:hypothetical protein